MVGGFFRLSHQLDRAEAQLKALAAEDPLTGILNRRRFLELADVEWARALRHGRLQALLLIDVDDFKAINDRHGHMCGDEALRRTAEACRVSLRRTDLLGRYGGDEFIVLLLETEERRESVDCFGILTVADAAVKACLPLVLCAAAAAAAGAESSRPVVLEPGPALERELGGDRVDVFTARLARGQFLHVIVEQRGIDVVVGVRSPDGKLLLERDVSTGAFGTERVSVIATTAGAYGVTLHVLDPQAVAGRYAIRVAELRESRPADRMRVSALAASIDGTRLRSEGSANALGRAASRFEEALSRWRSLGDRDEEALALYDLAWVARNRGENRRALDLYSQALAARS